MGRGGKRIFPPGSCGGWGFERGTASGGGGGGGGDLTWRTLEEIWDRRGDFQREVDLI